jgi:hypothetical protein
MNALSASDAADEIEDQRSRHLIVPILLACECNPASLGRRNTAHDHYLNINVNLVFIARFALNFNHILVLQDKVLTPFVFYQVRNGLIRIILEFYELAECFP